MANISAGLYVWRMKASRDRCAADPGQRNAAFPHVLMIAAARPTFMLIACIALVQLNTTCARRKLPDEHSPSTESQSEQIREAMDGITLITGLPPKERIPIDDPHAAAILRLGRSAGPALVEKLTDRTPTSVVYGFQYTIGDLALALLTEIYQPQGWPSPDDSVRLPSHDGDFRDYVDFMNSTDGREKLQASWRRYIHAHHEAG
jgi:hypothetical protein